jgi:hypothetical protein
MSVLKLAEVAAAAGREVLRGCGEREVRGELQRRALLLAVSDSATHPAFLAADLAAALASATTGHAFSSGFSE